MIWDTLWHLRNQVSGFLVGAATLLFLTWLAYVVQDWRRRNRRFYVLAEKLPGPKGLPLVGNIFQFRCKPEDFLDRFVEGITPYIDMTPIKIWLGPKLYVAVTKPRDLEIVLNSPKAACKSEVYRLLWPVIGDGLLSGSGHVWRSHRKLMAPMLSPKNLDGCVAGFERHSQILVEKLKPLANGTQFNVLRYMELCAIDIVSDTIMGFPDMNAQDDFNEDVLNQIAKTYVIIHARIFKVWLHPEWMFKLSSGYKEQCKAQRFIEDITGKYIRKQRQEYAASDSEDLNSHGGWKPFLRQLIGATARGGVLSEEELRDEVFTMFIASQDTMALISSCILLMLGIHDDVQQKVRDEVTDIVRDGEITPDLLPNLKYLELVVKETLRLFPIAPMLGRHLESDLQLDNCVLPGGCEVMLIPFITQRNPQYWKDPEKFIPERFLAEETAKRHPYTFLPFSAGLMSCIGQKFAMMCLKTITANVVRSYKLSSTTKLEDVKLKIDISIRFTNGYNISLQPL